MFFCVHRHQSEGTKQGTEQLTKPTDEEDAIFCLNLTYALLSFSLKHCYAVSFSSIMSLLWILQVFAAESDVLQANQVKITLTAFIKTYTYVFLAEKGQKFRFASFKHGQL